MWNLFFKKNFCDCSQNPKYCDRRLLHPYIVYIFLLRQNVNRFLSELLIAFRQIVFETCQKGWLGLLFLNIH